MSKTNDPKIMEKFQEKAKRPFGMRDKLGYAAGDFANDLTFIIASMFMMKFYTDIMGVSAALVGAMMMAAKFVDAFTDVAMGQIADRSAYTAKGKFAPWILRFAGPVAVSSFLIFAPYFANMPMGFKLFWMFLTYLLWSSVCYTGVNIPYGSMASAMTDVPEERQMLSTWRNIGATIAQLVIATILPLVVYETDIAGHQVINSQKMMIASGGCSALAIVLYVVCYHMCTERVAFVDKKKQDKNIAHLFKILFTNRAFLGIIVSALIMLLVQSTLSGMMNYVYPNYFNNSTIIAISGLLGVSVSLILAIFVNKVAARFGKKEIATFGAVISAAVMLALFFIHTHNLVLYVGLFSISFVGLGLFNLVCWAMIIDVIDEVEVKTGIRSDGTVYSVYSFARKLGQAASSGLTGILLSIAGYTAATAFDTNVVNRLYDLSTVVPGIGFALLAASLYFLYPLSKKKVAANVEALRRQRKDEEI